MTSHLAAAKHSRSTRIRAIRCDLALDHLNIVRWDGSVHRHFMVPPGIAERLRATPSSRAIASSASSALFRV